MGAVRRLLVLASAVMFLESLFFSALAPLLPELKRDLGISTAQSGLLVTMYALGLMVAVIPAGLLATRRGVKPCLVGGLVVLATMTLAFGLAQSYEALLISRLLQGTAAAGLWLGSMVWLIEAGPAERRGEMIGVVLSALAAGEIAGPALGAVAAGVGRGPTFGVAAVLAVVLCLVALRFPAPAARHRTLGVRTAARSGSVLTGMWLAGIPVMLLGVLSVLGPLQLDALGGGAGHIAATFLLASLAGVVVQPLVGRWSDRRSRLLPIRLGVMASAAMLLAVAWASDLWVASALLALALVVSAAFWGPTMALLSEACERARIGQVLAVAVGQFAGTAGFILGSSGGGAVADVATRAWAYAAVAALLVLLFVALVGRQEAPAPALSGDLSEPAGVR
jgi:DHA1 family solute carrier family 18 vesicular amine transporter 1/2